MYHSILKIFKPFHISNMQLTTICFVIVLQAGINECGLKSHAELIRLAIKADNKIKDLIHKVSGFVKGNSEFKENYENLRIPLMENYTSLPTKLAHIREFKAYNMERLHLEQRIISAISKLHTPMSEDCDKLSANVRKQLFLMLVSSNKRKIDALENLKKGSCRRESSSHKNAPTTKIDGTSNKIVNILQTRSKSSKFTESSLTNRTITFSKFFYSSSLPTFTSNKICKSSIKIFDHCLPTATNMAFTSGIPSDLTKEARNPKRSR
ncbi:uncharacterized protein LOC27207406 isoform X2 [Drosophila simulans]|uniref:uncharacterized protein LOC27207406 isoform X2 n=1 Tax=Drosophila simulans TaxID=7240 RepID=UPI001D1039B2|nr:uncharacterized protein LOC27207406 isoform X2 [Drosophila simulans]